MLIEYLIKHEKIVMPKKLEELILTDSTTPKEFGKAYTSLFKLRKDPKAA